MKPIETLYAGHRFRSRVEARWAVFFDAAGIKYEYEKEGYKLIDGTLYLPDFYLPDLCVWFEVKSDAPTEREEAKCEMLALESGKDVWLAEGNPEPRDQIHIFAPDPELTNLYGEFLFYFADDRKSDGAFWLVSDGGYAQSVGPVGADFSDKDPCVRSKTRYGYDAAKAARFEFGETPRLS